MWGWECWLTRCRKSPWIRQAIGQTQRKKNACTNGCRFVILLIYFTHYIMAVHVDLKTAVHCRHEYSFGRLKIAVHMFRELYSFIVYFTCNIYIKSSVLVYIGEQDAVCRYNARNKFLICCYYQWENSMISFYPLYVAYWTKDHLTVAQHSVRPLRPRSFFL